VSDKPARDSPDSPPADLFR